MSVDAPARRELPAPQPVGAFPFPVGLLLVPAGLGHLSVANALSAGRLPESWPVTLEPLRLAHEGDLDAALGLLRESTDAVSAYNAWVLDPATAHWSDVRSALPTTHAPLVDVVAWTTGQVDHLGEVQPDATAPEVLALVHTARSAAALDADQPVAAQRALREARAAALDAGLPVLAATVEVSLSSMLLEGTVAPDQSVGCARDLLVGAHEALRDTDLAATRAEVLLGLGSLAQEEAAAGNGDARALLHEAARHYYDALQLVGEEDEPVLWARLQLNLAAAHLAVPMTTASDQLRVGIAAQALRAARRVLDVGAHPGPWSTATINLANALVYTPSTHQGDNLVEAVELYEEVLASGVRDGDPLGRARLLANLGNALAHLGIFDHARARLVEARFVFEEHLDHDGAHTVRAVLDEVAKAELAASGVRSPGPEQDADLARQAEQLSRMPGSTVFTSGMGVQVLDVDAAPPPKPRITVVPPSSRPTGLEQA